MVWIFAFEIIVQKRNFITLPLCRFFLIIASCVLKIEYSKDLVIKMIVNSRLSHILHKGKRILCRFNKKNCLLKLSHVSCFETGGLDILPRTGNYVQPNPHARIVGWRSKSQQ